jgi:hypothetical protein
VPIAVQPTDIDVGPAGIFVVGVSGTPSGYRGYLKRFDPSGAETWSRWFDADRDEGWGSQVALTDDAIYVLTDQTALRKFGLDGSLSWEKPSDAFDLVDAFDGAVYVARVTGEYDAFLRKLDSDGRSVWSRRFGTPRYDYVWSLFVDETGVYISGETSGAFRGEIYEGGPTDAFVRAYSQGGRLTATVQYGTGVAEDAVDVVQLEGAVFFVGARVPRHRPARGLIGRIDGLAQTSP